MPVTVFATTVIHVRPRFSGFFFIHYYNNIIIMAGMAVVSLRWLPHRGEAQMAYN